MRWMKVDETEEEMRFGGVVNPKVGAIFSVCWHD